MIRQDYSFEETKEIVSKDLHNQPFGNVFLDPASNFQVLVNMMVECLDIYMETETLAEQEKRLKGGDKIRVHNMLVNLPFHILAEEYDGLEEYAGALLVLINNYYQLYEPEEKDTIAAAGTVSKVFDLAGSFSKMLLASYHLVSKMEKLIKVQDLEGAGLSEQFLSTLMNDHIDCI